MHTMHFYNKNVLVSRIYQLNPVEMDRYPSNIEELAPDMGWIIVGLLQLWTRA
jgi:hypothetical protein